MIRQAISCDICGEICGTDKKQINHWFVVGDHGAELRVSGWNSSNRLSPESMHLCGQTCLHKLLDDFMAKVLAGRVQPDAQSEAEAQAVCPDTSRIANTAYQEIETSARQPLRPAMELVSAPASLHADSGFSSGEQPRLAAHNWRTDSRARERELRAIEHRSDNVALCRSGS